MFDKSASSFPVKDHGVYLSHCGVAPLYRGAADALKEFCDRRAVRGAGVFAEYGDVLGRLHRAAGALLRTGPENLSLVKNTAEGMSLIAAGYPLEPGDEIISYVHEYPSNHYPWLLQQERGAVLKQLPDSNRSGETGRERPVAWRFEDLEGMLTDRTRIIAMSHVQFASGFAADVERLAAFCRERGIDLVLDAAQSLGSLPLYPEEWGVSAVVASGWKWLLGPLGSGLLYTSASLRKKIRPVMTGADIVKQGEDYLDHTWDPHGDGRFFEYSTSQVSYALALCRCLEDLFLPNRPETIRDEIFRLQDMFLSHLDADRCQPVQFDGPGRSGILSLICRESPQRVASALKKAGVIATVRGGYLRIAPHFYNDDEEMVRAARVLNDVAL